MHTLDGRSTTSYIGILWNVLGILSSGEMASREKHPPFLNYYRLALGRASNRKILLQFIIWQFSVKGGLETTRLNVSLAIGLVLDLSIARLSVSYHIKIFRVCVHGMLAQLEVNQMS